MKQKIGFIYFARLDREKWFDAILDMIRRFGKENTEIPFEIFVFGNGAYAEELKELTTKHKEVHYFGRQSLDTVKRYVNNCKYVLVPSTFLETFWLTALTGISRWLSAIGFKKWWLIPHIQSDLDLTHAKWETTAEKLYNIVKKITDPKFKLPHVEHNLKKYSIDTRKDTFIEMAGKNVKKILLVSDFKNRVGGIETYLHDTKAILEDMGYEVDIFGSHLPRGKRGKIVKYAGMFAAICNDWQAFRLKSLIRKKKPDLIRYHSVLRHLGRSTFWASKNLSAKKRMMYHDFWYVHPFPHALTDVRQINLPLTLKGFIKSANTKNPLKILAIIFKFCSLSLLRRQFRRNVDFHLVPSQFMEDIIHKSYKISPSKIKTFTHFIQD